VSCMYLTETSFSVVSVAIEFDFSKFPFVSG
jgi:hypothetical protein